MWSKLCKRLANLPANICTTDYMLNEARELTNKNDKFTLDYLGEEQMAELGMSCALAVGRGSDMSNYTVCMEYNGADNDDAPIVLVGKGLVFDNGGICIKPAAGMDSMKMDMGVCSSCDGYNENSSDAQPSYQCGRCNGLSRKCSRC